VVYGIFADWRSIIHIGSVNEERMPGISMIPNQQKLHVRFCDNVDWNQGYDPDMEISLNQNYKIKLECINTEMTLYVNGSRKTWRSNVIHKTAYQAPIYVGNPWFNAANAAIFNLTIR